MALLDIMAQNKAFIDFLSADGKSNETLQISLNELTKFRRKITAFNRRTTGKKIEKIGCFTTLDSTNKVTTYLVGTDSKGNIVLAGGGIGDGPPFYK